MSTATCAGNWGEWSSCSAICDDPRRTRVSATGTQKRTYTVTSGGTKIETEATCTKLCPVNCAGEYSTWGECNATCSNNQKSVKGLRKRTFSVTRSNFNGGEACDGTQLAEECTKLCPVNCVGEWTKWSDCEINGTCDGKEPFVYGKKKREYIISTPSSNGGNSCDIEDGTIETEDCRKECKVDSMFFWLTIGLTIIIGLIFIYGIYYYYKKRKATAAGAAALAAAPATGRGRRTTAANPASISSVN